ncbi:MAG TPA: hypothetical protein VNA12_07315 [Mycobacteriales bacterium]|nr:hypothetical protein [Mycobacteriales bacterium]
MTWDDDADALYAVPPEEFVAARDALARRLRAAGDAEAAATVRALRKPAVAAWLLNEVARDEPETLQRALDLADRLAAAQAHALSGGGGSALRTLAAERRAVVSDVVTAVGRVALRHAKDVSDAQREAIAGTVEAALADPAVAAAWTSRRLTQPERAAGFMFPAADPLPVPPSLRGKPGTSVAKASPQRTAPTRRRVARVADPPDRLRVAEQRAAELRRVAEDAREHVERLEAELGTVEAAVRAARLALRSARSAAAKAELFAATAEQAAWEAADRSR